MQHQTLLIPQFEEVDAEQPDTRVQLQERLEKKEGEVTSAKDV